MRESVEKGADREDLTRNRNALRSIKDDILIDVTLILLGSEKAVRNHLQEEEKVAKEGKDFEKLFTSCTPTSFYPDGEGNGPLVTVKGFAGENCNIRVEISGDRGPPGGASMDCSLPKEIYGAIEEHTRGENGPDQEFLSHCTGSLVDMIGKGPPSGPGGCRGSECETYCRNPEHRDECERFAREHGLNVPQDDLNQGPGRFGEGEFGDQGFGPGGEFGGPGPNDFGDEQFGQPPGGFKPPSGPNSENQPPEPGTGSEPPPDTDDSSGGNV